MAASIRARVASNLLRLLREHELTQRDFANKLGINESIVSKWLNEATYPQESSFDLIEDRLGWGYEELFRPVTSPLASLSIKMPRDGKETDALIRELGRAVFDVIKKHHS